MTDIELGWSAGIIDGEGCISLMKSARNIRRGVGKSYAYAITVSVASTDIRMLEKMHGFWSGSLTAKNVYQKPHHSQAWYWTVTGKNARAMLETLKSHLITKREQAEVVLEYQGGYRYVNQGVPPEEAARREDIRRRLTLLKGRGVAV